MDNGLITSGSLDYSKLEKGGSSFSTTVVYRVNQYLAFDIGWLRSRKAEYRATITADGDPYLIKISTGTSGPTLAAMGILPLGTRLELCGRAGMLFSKSSIDGYGQSLDESLTFSIAEKSRDPFVSLNAAFKFTDQISVYAGWQRIFDVGGNYVIDAATVSGETDVDNFHIGITFGQ